MTKRKKTITPADSRIQTSTEVAMRLALAALERVRPQARGVLVVMDIDEAIAGLNTELRGIETCSSTQGVL